MFSGDAHLFQAYPVILELLGDLMPFPLEAASKHVLAQVLTPTLEGNHRETYAAAVPIFTHSRHH